MPSRDYPLIYSALAKPYVDNVSSFGPQHKSKNLDKGDHVHLMAARMAEAGAMLHEERLGKMWLFSLEKKRLRHNPRAEEQPSSTHEEVVRKMDPGSSQCGMAKGWENNKRVETRVGQIGYKEKLLHSKDSQAL